MRKGFIGILFFLFLFAGSLRAEEGAPQGSQEELLDAGGGIVKSRLDQLERRLAGLERDVRALNEKVRDLDDNIDDIKRRHLR